MGKKRKDGELRFAGFARAERPDGYAGPWPHVTNRDLYQYEGSPNKWTALTGPFTGKSYDEAQLAEFSERVADPGPLDSKPVTASGGRKGKGK